MIVSTPNATKIWAEPDKGWVVVIPVCVCVCVCVCACVRVCVCVGIVLTPDRLSRTTQFKDTDNIAFTMGGFKDQGCIEYVKSTEIL